MKVFGKSFKFSKFRNNFEYYAKYIIKQQVRMNLHLSFTPHVAGVKMCEKGTRESMVSMVTGPRLVRSSQAIGRLPQRCDWGPLLKANVAIGEKWYWIKYLASSDWVMYFSRRTDGCRDGLLAKLEGEMFGDGNSALGVSRKRTDVS